MNFLKTAGHLAGLIFLAFFSTNVTAQTDTTIGSLQIGSWVSNPNHGAVAHKDRFDQSGQYALRQNDLGTTFINSAQGKHLHLRIGNQNALSIHPNRNVGIGIGVAAAKLHLADDVAPEMLISGGGFESRFGLATSNGKMVPLSEAGDGIWKVENGNMLLNVVQGDLALVTGGGENAEKVLVVNSEGKMGVGIAVPATEVDVSGKVQATEGFQIPGTIRPEIRPTGTGFVFHGATRFVGRRDFVNFNFLDMQVNIGQVQRFLPGYTLVVDGKAMVEDIEVQNSDNWPDFVFEEDYQLTNLSELETFVRKYKHLPDMPSASEVNKGVSVGEMQKALLQKIEEMTLYLIDLEKEVAKLKGQLADLD